MYVKKALVRLLTPQPLFRWVQSTHSEWRQGTPTATRHTQPRFQCLRQRFQQHPAHQPPQSAAPGCLSNGARLKTTGPPSRATPSRSEKATDPPTPRTRNTATAHKLLSSQIGNACYPSLPSRQPHTPLAVGKASSPRSLPPTAWAIQAHQVLATVPSSPERQID